MGSFRSPAIVHVSRYNANCVCFCVPTSKPIDIAGMAHCTVLQDDLRLAARPGCQSRSSKYHFARTCWQHALLRDVCSSLGACDLVRTTASPIDRSQLQVVYQATDTVSERLRRWARNPLGSARRGSNPLGVDFLYWRLCMQVNLTAANRKYIWPRSVSRYWSLL